MTPDVRLQPGAFDPGVQLAALERLGGGAVASFTGIVRGEGGLVSLRLDHYPGMAERAMMGIAEEAAGRWPLLGLVLIHRHGLLHPDERIVFVGTASRHRAAALDACAFLIDWAKAKAPFWKQETFLDGSQRWVEPRAIDDVAAGRW